MPEDKVSFLPEDYVSRRIEMRTNVICLSLFGIVLFAVIGAYMVTAGQRSSVLNKQQQINDEYAEAAKRIGLLDELQSQKKEMERKAVLTATLIEPVPRSNLLAELINRMPSTMTFEELEMKSTKIAPENPLASSQKGTALAAAKKNAAKKDDKDNKKNMPKKIEVPRVRVTLSLIGLAPTDIQVAQYMASLARCNLLQEVDLVFSEEARLTDESMRRFRIDMQINPNVDIRSIEPLMVSRNNGGFDDEAFLNPDSSDKD